MSDEKVTAVKTSVIVPDDAIKNKNDSAKTDSTETKTSSQMSGSIMAPAYTNNSWVGNMDLWQFSLGNAIGTSPLGPANDFDVMNFLNGVNNMPGWLSGLMNGVSQWGSSMLSALMPQWGPMMNSNMWNPGNYFDYSNYWQAGKTPANTTDNVDDGDDGYSSKYRSSGYVNDVVADMTVVNKLIEERTTAENAIRAKYPEVAVAAKKEHDAVIEGKNKDIAAKLAESLWGPGTNEPKLKLQLERKINKDNIVEVLNEYLETTKNVDHNSLITDIIDDYNPGTEWFKSTGTTLVTSEKFINRIADVLKERANTHVIKDNPNSPITEADITKFETDITSALHRFPGIQHDKNGLNDAINGLLAKIEKAEDPEIQETMIAKYKEELKKELEANEKEFAPKIEAETKKANDAADKKTKAEEEKYEKEQLRKSIEFMKLNHDDLIKAADRAKTEAEYKKAEDKIEAKIRKLREDLIDATAEKNTVKANALNTEISRLEKALTDSRAKLTATLAAAAAATTTPAADPAPATPTATDAPVTPVTENK